MRIHKNALLTLPALLSAFVVAVPSPAAYDQRPLDVLPPQPRWKSLSDRLIALVWGVPSTRSNEVGSNGARYLPPNTLARYGKDVVLRFNVTTFDEAASLREAADTLLLDVWDFTHDWVDIRLSKDIIPSLLNLLPPFLRQSHTPLLHDRELALAIVNTYDTSSRNRHGQTSSQSRDRQSYPYLQLTTSDDAAQDPIFFHEYRPLSVIEPWMRLLSRYYSNHARIVSIGQSYEGRDILGLRVGVQSHESEADERRRTKAVLVTGGMHAREWISTSTVSYIAYNLITSFGKDPDITNLLDQYEFVFIPTVNPDGYAYTWETDRLWRKNRQQTTVRFCKGIDLDHGFGFAWDTASTSQSTTNNPCSESYSGETPFEAIESKRLADWAKNESENNNVEFVGFLDLHSYSQQILYPYSYSCDDIPPSQENLEELALGMEKAIRQSSRVSYEPMSACEGNVASSSSRIMSLTGARSSRNLLPRIEEAGGSAIDWFYASMHVKYAYQIKLRDRGTYGFLLPKENIVPTGKEILDAVLYFGDFLKEGYPKQIVEGESAEEESEESMDGKAANDLGSPWVFVEEVFEEELVNEARKPDLRRRRRR